MSKQFRPFSFVFLCSIVALQEIVNLIIFFFRIPDSAAEPDLEIHATTDPAVIPLDDVTGSTDSTNDFTSTPWPEPRVQPPVPPPPVVVVPTPPTPIVSTNAPFQSPPMPFPQQPQPPFPPIGPFMPGPSPGMPMPPAGDCWRVCINFFFFYLFCKVLDCLIKFVLCLPSFNT